MLLKLALLQGIFYVATGVWPLIDIVSFQVVTGPKTDLWLVKTVGVLVTVIGLGYVGLPLALALAEAGFTVAGLDRDPSKVDSLVRGRSYLADVSSDRLTELIRKGCFSPSVDATVLRDHHGIAIAGAAAAEAAWRASPSSLISVRPCASGARKG